MKSLAATILSLAVLASSASAQSNQTITVMHPESQPSTVGPAVNLALAPPGTRTLWDRR
jgi:hypothetical protein